MILSSWPTSGGRSASPSWPGLTRPSTRTLCPAQAQQVREPWLKQRRRFADGRNKPSHDEQACPLTYVVLEAAADSAAPLDAEHDSARSPRSGRSGRRRCCLRNPFLSCLSPRSNTVGCWETSDDRRRDDQGPRGPDLRREGGGSAA